MFDPHQRWGLALLIDLAWLYLVALLTAVDDMSRLHVADPAAGLRQVIVGSEHELRERSNLAEQLLVIFAALPVRTRDVPEIDVLPAYFNPLLDLVDRLLPWQPRSE